MHCRLSVFTIPVVVAAGIIVGGQAASAESRIYGIARVPMIKGQPAAGYFILAEWDVYVAPDDNALVGQARRTGTTIFNGSCIDKYPQGGGDYCVGALSANTYSVYCNQPDFAILQGCMSGPDVPAALDCEG